MIKYIIAIYLRLSVDDKKVESMSIESQRALLRKYAESHFNGGDMEIIEYVDNGYSGTNFERPAVQQLLNDVRAFKVNCIIVKDFSRFGRNSIEVGYFTQQVFPLFNVRFISVSDGFDSEAYKGDTGGMEVAVKYLVNEYYSRDLSVKTKSAKYLKMRRGEYDAGVYCYGYKKGTNGKTEIDEAVSGNVKLIFELSAEGKSTSEICKVLTEKSVPTPGQYKAMKGMKYHNLERCKYWVGTTILRILENEQYIGTFVACKQTVREVGSTRMRERDESEWIRIPDHHPAIISKELFDKVQQTRLTFKQPHKQQRIYPLKGKVFCGCCKHTMDYLRKKKHEYICYYTKHDENEPCYRQSVAEDELHSVLFEIISKQAEVIANIDSVADLDKLRLQTEQYIELEKQLEACQEEKQRLYEKLLTYEIDIEKYQAMKGKCDEKMRSVQARCKKCGDQVEQMKLDSKTRVQMIQIAKDVKKENTLTQALADTLIDKVQVYPDKRLEIVWKIQDFFGNMAAVETS